VGAGACNGQTDFLLGALGLPHIWTRPCPQQVTLSANDAVAGSATAATGSGSVVDANEISLDDI
jgi:hypothetical protein